MSSFPEAPVIYAPNFIQTPDEWFATLWAELNWERRPDAPRREYWTNTYNRPYTYGRGQGTRTYQSQAIHPVIQTAQEMLFQSYAVAYEGCFLNGYEGKRDWLGWHADDDPGIDHSRPIVVITLGQARAIQFRRVIRAGTKGDKGEYGFTESLTLENGSLCFMLPGMQQTYEHRIPKTDFEAKPRISLTFRGLLPQE